MSSQRPDITDEDIGMRALELRRERAVEYAVDRLRRGAAERWRTLDPADYERLTWLLGELWSFVTHSEWNDLHFSGASGADIDRLLEFAAELRAGTRPADAVLSEAEGVVRAQD